MTKHHTDEAVTSNLDPFSAEVLRSPYAAHDALREAGPVTRIEKYEVFAIARHEHVQAALRDPATFSSAAGVGLVDLRSEESWRPPSLLLEADPPEHADARRVVTSVLTPRVVSQLRESFTLSAKKLVERILSDDAVDGVHDIAEAFPLTVFPDAVGLDPELPLNERRNLLVYGRMVNNGFGPRNEFYQKAMRDAQDIAGWIMDHCDAAALRPGTIGRQIHEAAADAGFSPADGAMLVRSLLSAGVETTVNAIANALLCLAEHPDQWQLLRGQGEARKAFEETVRYESPVQVFFRTTTRAVPVGGITIPEAHKVMLFLGAANRDPRAWSQPDRFDIGRRATGHVGFGAGIHACVGQMMARLEGEVLLDALAERVTALEIAGPPSRLLNNTLRGLESLPLRLVADS